MARAASLGDEDAIAWMRPNIPNSSGIIVPRSPGTSSSNTLSVYGGEQ